MADSERIEAPPAWLTDTGRYYVRDLLHDEALRVIAARVPKWTAGSMIAVATGALAVFAAIGVVAVAMERTKEIPELRAIVARHQTAIEVNTEAHKRMLESLERIERRVGSKP